MPYIDMASRQQLQSTLGALSSEVASLIKTKPDCRDGVLNYVVSSLINNHYPADKSRYKDYNAAIGMLSCCLLELYRRQIADYEDQKIAQHGDVYTK